MHIAAHLDRARVFRWHLALIKALEAAGHSVIVRFRDTSEPLPTSLTAILDFDRVRTHAGIERYATRMSPDAFAQYLVEQSTPVELSIDLSVSSRVRRIDGRVLRAFYDGEPKDYTLFHALLDQRAPHLTVLDTDSMRTWDIGLPALETPMRLGPSLDQVTSRLVEGLTAIVARIAAGERAPIPHEAASSDLPGQSMLQSASGFASARARRKLVNVRDRITGDAPRWHVAWRKVFSETPDAAVLDLSEFRILAEDGKRFYADPFVFVHNATCHVFIEELPDTTGIGVISHFVIGGDGEATRPRCVLEEPHHLSYPLVFARDGQIWMLPEQAAGGGLDLYRADPFPDRWVKEARLIDGRLHDATLFEHDGLLWIAAGSEAPQSSTWDALSLYWASSLTGPWTAHARNPVLVDARSSRPAGPLWRDGGRLLRPAQDCSGGYGSRLTIAAITELSPTAFAQEVLGHIQFGASHRLLGPHTICRGGGYEVVDIYARPGAILAGYRSPTTI